MSIVYPVKISYVAKSRIWGGDMLEKRYFKKKDGGNIGETWELSVRGDEMSRVDTGDDAGLTLGEYIEKHPGVLGSRFEGGRFPLLIKFIDAHDRLSVQVHPDDVYAGRVENDSGKTEMWYIIDAKPGAKIVYGFAEGIDRAAFSEAVKNGKTDDVLGWRTVRPGETYFIPSGLVHAIGDGILIAEIQQNSDLTYRVYDYNRLDADGRRRELHIEKALDVSRPFTEKDIYEMRFEARNMSDDENTLAHCRFFRVSKYDISGERRFMPSGDTFFSVLCISGGGKLICGTESLEIKAGDSFFVPAGTKEWRILGKTEVIVSSV